MRVNLIDELRAEHELIEQVVGALRTFVAKRASGRGDPADAEGFLTFFRVFAGDYHHLREEQYLLAALVRDVGLPADRGPVAEIFRQHEMLARARAAVRPLLETPRWSQHESREAIGLSCVFCDALLRHIDLENSVLFPEAQARLKRCGAHDLGGRPASEIEERARATGAVLRQRYPPTENSELIRGDGCVVCPAYGETCRGLEQEWWTDAEWEHFHSGAGSD